MSVLGWSGSEIRNIFSGDEVLLDNYLFKLHHQLNFFFVLFGAVFATGMNYLKDDSIICANLDSDDYRVRYCWLHGSGHIPESLEDPSLKMKCVADQSEENIENSRHTHYYLWIPFVLALCLVVIKAPRILWSEVCERGMIKGVVQIANEKSEKKNEKKLSARFLKLRGRALVYGASYFVCEALNIVSVLACFSIVDTLLGGKFWYYGKDYQNYDQDVKGAVNPLCNVFPTEVSCNVRTGGSTGNPDKDNILCILSNNLFNQYYFLVLWWWWVVLLALSALGFVYRLVQFLHPAFGRNLLITKVAPYGQAKKAQKLRKLNQWDFFLLGRICQNLKGSQIDTLLEELVPKKNEKDDLDKLENHIYIQEARAMAGPGTFQQQPGPVYPGGFSPFQDPFQSSQMQPQPPQGIVDRPAMEI